jgi:hypothetical protein
MITLSVPRFAKSDFALHERLCFTLEMQVQEVPPLAVELQCSYSEIGRAEQLLDVGEMAGLDVAGAYRLPMSLGLGLVGERCDGILFVRALYGGRQFYQCGILVHSGRLTRTLATDTPFVVHDHTVWHQ